MKLDGTVYCEGPDCEVHQHVGPSTMENRRLPVGWVVVRFFEDNGHVIEHGFCEPNSALKWLAANTEPSTVIPWDGDS